MARIVVLHPGDDSYGLDRVALASAHALRDCGHEVRFVIDSSNPGTGWLSDQLTRHSFAYTRLDLSHLSRSRLGSISAATSWLAGWFFHQRRLLLETRDSDLVYLNGFPLLLVGLTLRLSGRHILWHLHEIPTRGGSAVGWVVRLLSSSAVCVSQAVADAFRLPPGAATVVHNGVVVPERAVDQHIDADQPVRIGIVARRNAWKGHLVLIAAARRLFQAGVPFELHLAGGSHRSDPDSDVAIERALEPLRLAGVVVDHGEVDDGAEVMPDLHVLVAPSLRPDPFPLSVLEGMAAGLAVVATAIGGHCEQIDDGTTGRLLPPNDPVTLEHILRELTLGQQEREQLGEAARSVCVREFSEAGYAQRIVAAVESVMT